MSPTKSEKMYWAFLSVEVGCVACKANGITNHHVSIHHVNGRTRKGAHMEVLPLCGFHHQGGNEHDPSVHPWKSRFEQKYGTQAELMENCRRQFAEPNHEKQTDWSAA